MSQNYNPDKTSSFPGVTVKTDSVAPEDPIEPHIPEQDPPPSSNDTPPAAKDPEKEKPANPGKDNKGSDDSPRMPDFSKDEAGGNGDSWSNGGKGSDLSCSEAENFLTENMELIKKIKNILDFVYPNSGITLAELLTGAKECMVKFLGHGSGGSGDDSSTAPAPAHGSGESEISPKYPTTTYSIYIDNQTESIEQGIYAPDQNNLKQHLHDFIEDKCITLFWADNDKQLFDANFVIKNDPNKPDWIIRTLTFKFYNADNYPSFEDDKYDLQEFSFRMGIMHIVGSVKRYDWKFSDNSQRYFLSFHLDGEEYSDIAIQHVLEKACTERSRIRNVIKDTTVSSESITAYLNAVYRESEKRIEEIKNSAKVQKDIRAYVFDELTNNFLYDVKAMDSHYDLGNNLPSALATNTTKCHGIASAYFRVMNELGIHIAYTHSPKNTHAWNYEIITKEGKQVGVWYDLTFQVGRPESQNPPRAFYQFHNDIRFYHIIQEDNSKRKTAFVIKRLYNENKEDCEKKNKNEEEVLFSDDVEAYIYSNGMPIKSTISLSDFDGISIAHSIGKTLYSVLGNIETNERI